MVLVVAATKKKNRSAYGRGQRILKNKKTAEAQYCGARPRARCARLEARSAPSASCVPCQTTELDFMSRAGSGRLQCARARSGGVRKGTRGGTNA